MSILRAENVSYRYEKTENYVLEHVNAEFEKGKLYILTGKSGAGKSTFLSLLSGLDRVNEGRILYKDRDLSKMNLDRYRASEIGVIFQSYNLLKNCSAVENILLSERISRGKKGDRKQVYELLKRLGISEETAERKVMHISGGEQQRVCIARALSHSPEIVMADEPTGNLDEANSCEIMRIFRRLAHEEGRCVIVISHTEKMWSYGDEIYTIGGKKVKAPKGS
ncbi:MAG: ABC transporter ATP-binding protein [Lachnospiraceae bacterium]|nr:ABC transporter ATP-binding protein [Lachnospiraceae bacterium]